MSARVTRLTLAAAVASGGTFTVNYPAGTSRGSYVSGKRHRLIANGATYECPRDFTIAFNAASATITYNGGTPLQAGLPVAVQLDTTGEDDPRGLNPSVSLLGMYNVNLGSPAAAASNNIATSQSVTIGTTPLAVLNGTLVSAGVAILDVPRNVVASWTGTAVLTVTGIDEYGEVLVESSASGTSFTGRKAFKTVTRVSMSANVTGLTVGTGSVLGLPIYVRDVSALLSEIQDGVVVGGPNNGPVRLNWFGDSTSVLAGTTAALELIAPVTGVITGMTVVTRVAVGTGGNVTAAIGTTAIAGLSVAVANSSAKGTTTSDTPTVGDASTFVNRGDRIQIIFDDAFATTGALDGFIEIRPTGAAAGTLVNGLAIQTRSTATTADVRGTYAPATTPDGTIGYALMLAIEDPTFLGNPQFAG